MTVYLKTSGAAKLLVEEDESRALADHLDRLEPDCALYQQAGLLAPGQDDGRRG